MIVNCLPSTWLSTFQALMHIILAIVCKDTIVISDLQIQRAHLCPVPQQGRSIRTTVPNLGLLKGNLVPKAQTFFLKQWNLNIHPRSTMTSCDFTLIIIEIKLSFLSLAFQIYSLLQSPMSFDSYSYFPIYSI